MKIRLKVTRENEDGSADAIVDYDDEGLQIIVQYGVIAMLKEALDHKEDRKEIMQLEDAIQAAYSIADDIDTLFRYHGDAPNPMSDDEVSSTLVGMYYLAKMKIDNIWEAFIKREKLDRYSEKRQKFGWDGADDGEPF
jgi:hypothetical protein